MERKIVYIIDDNIPFACSLERAIEDRYEVRQCFEVSPATEQEYFDTVIGLLETFNNISIYNSVLMVSILPIAGQRYKRLGMDLIERIRRDYRLLDPVIILSLDCRERLADKYPIMGEEIPGSYFIKLPFELDKLMNLISTVKYLTPEELKKVVVNYCHLEDSLVIKLHDIINSTANRIDEAIEEFHSLKKDVIDFLPGEFDFELTEIDKMLSNKDEVDKDALRNLFFSIREVLYDPDRKHQRKEKITQYQQSEDIYVPTPPRGFEYISIVDDDGYDNTCMTKLEDKGYGVEIITTYNEAMIKLEFDPPDVLLCDLRLEGDPKLGLAVANYALSISQVKLVIMISADEISKDEVPIGVEICAGRDKFNVELIHASICNKAIMRGKI
jgi:ActR/RegA family two-component response regulator